MDFDRGTKPRTNLLRVDGAINLVLGALLLAFPSGLVETLGVPSAEGRFYPSLLGAVLFGVGIALFLEAHRLPGGIIGLGLGGAVAINLVVACRARVLALVGRSGDPHPGQGAHGRLDGRSGGDQQF